MIIDQPLVKRIMNYYNLGTINSVEPLVSGFQSDNALIGTTNGKYIVRHMHAEPNSIKLIMYIYEFLAEHDFPTAKPVKTIDERYFCEIGVNRFCIQDFIDGTVPTTESKRETQKLTEFVGQTIAKWQNILKNIDQSKIEKFDPTYKDKDIINYLTAVKLEANKIYFPNLNTSLNNKYVAKQYEQWLNELDEIDLDKLSKGFCHNDAKLSDFVLDSDGNLIGVLDFGAVSHNFYLYDIASFMMYTNMYQPEIAKMFFDKLLTSYLEISPMKVEEIDYLNFFLQARFIFQVFLFFSRIEMSYTQGVDNIEDNKKGMEDGIVMLKTLEKLPKNYYKNLINQ